MAKFDPDLHDDNPLFDAAFMAGMTPSRRERSRLKTPKVGHGTVRLASDLKPNHEG